jgi:hypothetical protein
MLYVSPAKLPRQGIFISTFAKSHSGTFGLPPRDRDEAASVTARSAGMGSSHIIISKYGRTSLTEPKPNHIEIGDHGAADAGYSNSRASGTMRVSGHRAKQTPEPHYPQRFVKKKVE